MKSIRILVATIRSTMSLSKTSRIVFGILILWALVDAILTFRDFPNWKVGLFGFTLSLGWSFLFIAFIAMIWGWLSRRYRRRKPYVDEGLALTHRLTTSFNLPGWTNLEPTYRADELEAIDRKVSGFQEMTNEVVGGDAIFHPEVAPELSRRLVAKALADLAESKCQWTDGTATNWKECAATYLKAWAAQLDPLTLLKLGDLLTKSGYPDEAKEAYRVVLLFPSYADTFYSGQHNPELVNEIVNTAKESLEELT